MSTPSDGGQRVSTVPALESSGHSYLVRMIKPNLIPSHDWHVQPICQRSLRLIRLSGPFGSRPWVLPQGVLELVALAKSASYGIHRHFCANLLNLSNFHLHVKLNLFLAPGRSNSLLADSPWAAKSRLAGKVKSHSKASHSAKSQRATSKPHPSR
jgi:hypothetical protein